GASGRIFVDCHAVPVALDLRSGRCPAELADRGHRTSSDAQTVAHRDYRDGGTYGVRGVDLVPAGKSRASSRAASEGFVDIDSGWDPRSHYWIRSSRRSGVVQGDGRGLDRRLGTHHASAGRRDPLSDAAALFAPWHIAGDL